MNRITVFLIIIAIFLVLEFYTYQGLKVAISSLGPLPQRVIKMVFWTLTVITIASFLLFEPMSKDQGLRKILTVMMTIGVANILGKVIFSLMLLLEDVTRGARYVWQRFNPEVPGGSEHGITRSEFISQAGAITAAVPMLAMGWGVFSGAHDYRVIKRTLKIAGLPEKFHGMTITQISDLHSGSFWNRKAVERGIEMVNEQGSDMIFFTGDIVNNLATELDDWKDLFSTLKAREGVYSILGNHDYGDYVPWPSEKEKRENLERLIETQRQMGWDVLLDENRVIKRDDQSLAVIGVQNWGDRGRFPKYGDLAKAMRGVEKEPVKLLLSHDPSHWKGEVLKKYPDINATFSGHTHGFQFGIEVGQVKWSPVKYFYPEWADLYEENGQLLYVNRGFGYIGYPGRLGILPEITVFNLQPAV